MQACVQAYTCCVYVCVLFVLCACVFFHVLSKVRVMSGNRVIWVIFQKLTQPNNETLMHTILMERTRLSKMYL